MPAGTLDDIFSYFQNRSISLEEFEDLYVNADKGRGRPSHGVLKRRLLNDPEGSLKMLFAGHRGCGKSTELVRLQREIGDDFVILNFSVREELDIVNINYVELFIVTMEKLFEFLQNEENISPDPDHIEDIKRWVLSKEIMEVNRQYMDVDVQAGMEAKARVPFLLNFFAKFRAAAKSSTTIKETLTTKVAPRLSRLIDHCNTLIEDIKGKLHNVDKKGLVLIIEDLDKVDLKKGEDIFYTHSTQLAQLNCHCIFTFPIALLYNIKFNAIRRSYDEDFVLPMIKVFEKDGRGSQDGMDVMKQIVWRRMERSLFEDDAVLVEMIKYSGGCLWDLFGMIRDAADSALDFERRAIKKDDFRSAYLSLKSNYEFTIAENKEKQITVEQYYEALCECALDDTKKPKSSDIMLDLRHNLTVLDYNGERWNDVHPIVKDILKERKLI